MELRGRVVTPEGVVAGVLRFGATVESVRAEAGVPDRVLLPGFVDAHVHGGGGGDAMDGAAGIAALARLHLRHGTTTLLPTTVTRPWPEVLAALRAIEAARREGVRGGALVAGAHLEGPFISPRRLGAQPPFPIPPEPARVREALAAGAPRVVTLAPELEGAEDAAVAFARAGTRVSLGHSAASCEAAERVLSAVRAAGGVCGGTHLFNAMGGVEGRAPGLAGALLGSPHAHAELILDGHHVHDAAFRLAHAALGRRLLLVTDAIRAAGLPEGDSELGGHPVTVRGGAARLADGTLAGSVLTLDAALRRLVGLGVGLAEAARLCSGNAAAYLGLPDRGALRPGLRADVVVLDGGLRVVEVWVGGVREV